MMKNSMRTIILIYTIFLMAVYPSFAHEYYSIGYDHSIKGEIFDVISDTNTVIIKQISNKNVGSFKEINCPVNDQTQILKEGIEIDIDQLFPGDKVIVEMGVDEKGDKITYLIKVINSDDQREKGL